MTRSPFKGFTELLCDDVRSLSTQPGRRYFCNKIDAVFGDDILNVVEEVDCVRLICFLSPRRENLCEFLAMGSLPLLVLALGSECYIDKLPLAGKWLNVPNIPETERREVDLIAVTIAAPPC